MWLIEIAKYFEKKANREKFRGNKYMLWSVDYIGKLPDTIYLNFSVLDRFVEFSIKQKEYNDGHFYFYKRYRVKSDISGEIEMSEDRLFKYLKEAIEDYIAEEVEKEQRKNNTLDKDWRNNELFVDAFKKIDNELEEIGY